MGKGYLKVVEKVPVSFVRRGGDWAQEGGNNTLIVMGTDRVSPDGPATLDDGLGSTESDGGGTGTGTVMIVAGRQDMAGGNPDINNDDTTLYLSQKTDADTNLGLGDIVDTFDGAPAAILESDNIRLVYRSSTKIAAADASNYLYFDDKKIEIKVSEKSTITIEGEKILIECGNSFVTMDDGKITIQAGTIEMGDAAEGGDEGIILGKSFTTFFDTHIHMTPTGPSSPPTPKMQPLATNLVSQQSYVRLK
jgi:hypothetical protein